MKDHRRARTPTGQFPASFTPAVQSCKLLETRAWPPSRTAGGRLGLRQATSRPAEAGDDAESTSPGLGRPATPLPPLRSSGLPRRQPPGPSPECSCPARCSWWVLGGVRKEGVGPRRLEGKARRAARRAKGGGARSREGLGEALAPAGRCRHWTSPCSHSGLRNRFLQRDSNA